MPAAPSTGPSRRNLGRRHDVVRVGRASGDVRVDITDPASIHRFYAEVGEFDALVSTTGRVHFGPLARFTPEQFDVGLRDKLMGQVNLVVLGLARVRAGGSFTLTSGLLNDDPVRDGASAAMVNGALEGFVRGAAVELPRGLRINLVSPSVVGRPAGLCAALSRREGGARTRGGAGLRQERGRRADGTRLSHRPVEGRLTAAAHHARSSIAAGGTKNSDPLTARLKSSSRS